MQLTTIQYDAIMAAINNYKSDLLTDDIATVYENQDYTADNLNQAITEVEDKIIKANIPN